MNAKTLYDTYAQLERISVTLLQLLNDDSTLLADKALIAEFERRIHKLKQILANMSADAHVLHWDGIDRRQKP